MEDKNIVMEKEVPKVITPENMPTMDDIDILSAMYLNEILLPPSM